MNKGKKGKIAFSLMIYMQTVEASSSTIYQATYDMMWENQAVQFWQTVGGGSSSEEEAAQGITTL